MHVHVYTTYGTAQVRLFSVTNTTAVVTFFSFLPITTTTSLSLLILHVSNSQPQLSGTTSLRSTNKTRVSVNGDKTRATSYRSQEAIQYVFYSLQFRRMKKKEKNK
ncbi:uncharacterized protein TrAtP1_003504 [Trichoderma atroviride]|uniref:uncharacterized protein n=1 Tax=Hypocrea atroviridis TaxID=63577 RepID=UPI00331B6811|nr:hypothetical protein TrAtP1_003504 [Trichoderma atroviride]